MSQTTQTRERTGTNITVNIPDDLYAAARQEIERRQAQFARYTMGDLVRAGLRSQLGMNPSLVAQPEDQTRTDVVADILKTPSFGSTPDPSERSNMTEAIAREETQPRTLAETFRREEENQDWYERCKTDFGTRVIERAQQVFGRQWRNSSWERRHQMLTEQKRNEIGN